MPLAPGTRLGPYEIIALAGTGGMGEVYRACDTRLDRTVAIKILPRELAADPQRRRRFEQEARAVSSLNHPHICTLHDIGRELPTGGGGQKVEGAGTAPPEDDVGREADDPIEFLVLEYVEGQTLAARLAHKGRLRVEQVLDYGIQVAEALAAAHRCGVVHRDLKPDNVMITRAGVKLLDFGLARPSEPGDLRATDAVSAVGTVVGTLPYMAPEQVQGAPVDARTDLWSLGAILYEMLTGKRAFEGPSAVSVIAAILERDAAPIVPLQPLTPPALDRLVRSCLARSPDDRPDTAHDVAMQLRGMRETASAAAPASVAPRRGRLRTMALASVFGLAGVLAGAIGLGSLRPRPPALPPVHSQLDVRPAEDLNGGGLGWGAWPWIPSPGGAHTSLTWTPDGRALIFVGRRGGLQQLYLRPLDADQARPIAGTEGAQAPIVTPDGRFVVFFANRALRKAPLRENVGIDVVRDPGLTFFAPPHVPPNGAVFDERADLLVGGGHLGIGLIPGHGDPRWLIQPQRDQGESRDILPWPLPGGRAILYTAQTNWWLPDEQIVAATLGTGERRLLVPGAGDARYLPTGHLVFLRGTKLFAVPFDPQRLEFLGDQVPLLDEVARGMTAASPLDLTHAGQYAVSSTGALAWVSGGTVPFPGRALVAVNRQGDVTRLGAPSKFYVPGLSLSPDGRRLAVTSLEHAEGALWTADVASGQLEALVVGGLPDSSKWTPDGERVTFVWERKGAWGKKTVGWYAWRRADRTAEPEPLSLVDADGRSLPWDGTLIHSSWHPDGRQLAMVERSDIAVAAVDGHRATMRRLTETAGYGESSPEFSPDGRWLAYSSDESRRHEIYVRPYPGPGASIQVSRNGGYSPAWGKGGRELYFLGPRDEGERGRMMVADFRSGSTPRITNVRVLFEYGADLCSFTPGWIRSYAVSADGERFYAVQSPPPPPLPPVTHVNLVLNWFDELKAKVPRAR